MSYHRRKDKGSNDWVWFVGGLLLVGYLLSNNASADKKTSRPSPLEYDNPIMPAVESEYYQDYDDYMENEGQYEFDPAMLYDEEQERLDADWSEPDYDEPDEPSAGNYKGQVKGCPYGCAIPPAGCAIKGNISVDSGAKIYHLPGQKFYASTRINTQYGERWFCTEEEAAYNGWRKSSQ